MFGYFGPSWPEVVDTRKGVLMKNRVLIIDHDKATCKEIKYSLASDTTDVYYCLTVQDGLTELARKDYELVILSISFPETDGMELLHTMRQLKAMPILLLSTSAALDDKVRAFKLGADDYLTKPFEIEECLARAYAMLRRFTEPNSLKTRAYSFVAYNNLLIRQEGRQVLLCGTPLDLTRREYDLLCLFATHPGRVYTFEQLYEQLWPDEYLDGKNSVVCQVRRLRKKLTGTDFIENVRDVGFRFKEK